MTVENIFLFTPSSIDAIAGVPQTIKVAYIARYSGDTQGNWASSDPSLVSVSASGAVTGLQNTAGSAVLTYTVAGVSGTVPVTVRPLFTVLSDNDNNEVVKDYKMQLSVNFDPAYTGDTAGNWVSSDDTIATVSEDGKVKGIKAGTATVTFTHTASGVQSSCTVIVTNPQFTVTPDPLEIKTGMTGSLAATFDYGLGFTGPEDGTWSIADSSVAEIDQNGTVTGIAAGTTTATFTHTASGVQKSCTVMVVSPEFTITPDPLEIRTGETGSFTVTFEDGYTGPEEGTWSVADDSVASIDQTGTVTGITVGKTFAVFRWDCGYIESISQIVVTESATCTVSFDPNGGSPVPTPLPWIMAGPSACRTPLPAAATPSSAGIPRPSAARTDRSS